jgi:endoglucanase
MLTLRPFLATSALLLAFALGTGIPTARQATDRKPLEYTGTNLAGAEFGPALTDKPPVHDIDYTYPHENEVNYFASKGMNVFRIPFRWEAMQNGLGQELAPAELERLKTIVDAVTSKGFVAILDHHNYGRYYNKPIGSPEVPAAAFASFWDRLSRPFKDNPRVWFGLMNEPHDMPSEDWLTAANAAISAIRKGGATNRILVPGNHWSGAHSWVGSDNGEVMLRVQDPQNNFLFDVHQYLDSDSSGSKPTVESATVGVERLKSFVDWCRTHKKRAFLGEFGVAASEDAKAALQNMLASMERDRDVWVGFTYWAAGPRWGDYMFSIEPKELRDRPQLDYLRPFLQPVAMSPLPARTKG